MKVWKNKADDNICCSEDFNNVLLKEFWDAEC